MGALVRKLPFYDHAEWLSIEDARIRVPSYAVVLWVGVGEKGSVSPDEKAPKIPALLDTGFNDNFAIREEQLRDWAGVDPRLFSRLRTQQHERGTIDRREANIWLHPNVPKTIECGAGPPLLLELDEGILVLRGPGKTVQPSAKDLRPRLPLVGLRALERNRLVVSLDCSRRRVDIGTARRLWFGV